MARQNVMYDYSDEDDLDRHSPEPPMLSKIKAQVKIVTTMVAAAFMDKDSPLPLSKSVLSDLVNILPSLCALVFLSVLIVRNPIGDQTYGVLPSTPT